MNYSRSVSLLLLINIFIISILSAQDIPERPVPPRLVNDYAGMLSDRESDYLEQKLTAFNDSTSNQIAIVIINTLDGYDIMDYAQRLGEKWGIGQKQLNNGILILVKPGSEGSKGEITIVQGYGLEAAIPDITCAQIIDNEILPAFRGGAYFEGLDNATSALMSLARGEFSSDEYGKSKKSSGEGSVAGLIIFIVFVIIMIIGGRSKGSNNRNIGSGNLPLWLLLGMLNSGGSHKGSWGGFSGGSRGGGGFGGFGGGSFGGGGARGSW